MSLVWLLTQLHLSLWVPAAAVLKLHRGVAIGWSHQRLLIHSVVMGMWWFWVLTGVNGLLRFRDICTFLLDVNPGMGLES